MPVYSREDLARWLDEDSDIDIPYPDSGSEPSSDSDQSVHDQEADQYAIPVELSYEGSIQLESDIIPDLLDRPGRRCTCPHHHSSDDEVEASGNQEEDPDDDDNGSWVEISSNPSMDEETFQRRHRLQNSQLSAEEEVLERQRQVENSELSEAHVYLRRLHNHWIAHHRWTGEGVSTFFPDWSEIAPNMHSPELRAFFVDVVVRFAQQEEPHITGREILMLQEAGIPGYEIFQALEGIRRDLFVLSFQMHD